MSLETFIMTPPLRGGGMASSHSAVAHTKAATGRPHFRPLRRPAVKALLRRRPRPEPPHMSTVSGSLFVYIYRKQYTNGTLVASAWRMEFFTPKLQLAPSSMFLTVKSRRATGTIKIEAELHSFPNIFVAEELFPSFATETACCTAW